MTVTDAIGRIAQIQATLVQLDGAGKTATTGTTAKGSASSTSATDFASALSGALGATQGASTGSVTGADVVADAKKYLGVPYVFGGTTTAGMDCSGLVQTVFKDLGVTMPRVVPDQADMGVPVGSLKDAQPGDLIVPKGEQHIVIYVGDVLSLRPATR